MWGFVYLVSRPVGPLVPAFTARQSLPELPDILVPVDMNKAALPVEVAFVPFTSDSVPFRKPTL